MQASLRSSATIVALLSGGLIAGCNRANHTLQGGTVFVSGRIEGDEITIASRVTGRIAAVVVREGDTVTAGQVLVRLSEKRFEAGIEEAAALVEAARRRREQAAEYVKVLESRSRQLVLQEEQARVEAQGRVSEAEGQVAAAQADLIGAQAESDQARADAERYAELAAKGGGSRQQSDQGMTRAKVAEARVRAAEKHLAAVEGALAIARTTGANAEIRAADQSSLLQQISEARAMVRLADAQVGASKASLNRARVDVEDLVLLAPVDGQVITRTAEPGQIVSAGATLLTIIDPQRLYLRGFIPEGLIGHVAVGQSAHVFLDSAPETPLAAEVMRIDPQAMFTPENTYFKEDRVRQVFGVKLLLKAGSNKVKLGMPADARIQIAAAGGGH